MVDIATILSMLGSVAAVVGPLTALLWDRLNRLEDRLDKLIDKFEGRVNRIGEEFENRIGSVEKRLESVESRTEGIEKRLTGIENELSDIKVSIYELSRSMVGFSNTLIAILAIKSVITQSEATALRGYLLTIPIARTKYYTKEDEEKLRYLITVKPYEEYTWDDVRTLREIADHMIKEFRETGREELLDYAYKLLFFTWIAEGHLIAGIIGPNRKKQSQEGQQGQQNQPCQG